MRVFLITALLLAACAPVTNVPPAEPGSDDIHFNAERVSADVIRLSLDNGTRSPIGYNLCTSELQRRGGSEWVTVPTDEVCTMELRTLNPGADATFEKRLPADLPPGEYRYVTGVESPLGTPQTRVATGAFEVR